MDAEERMFRQALTCWQQLGEPVGAAQSLFGLGLVFQVLHSDWMTAMPYYWQALGVVSDPDAKADLYLRSEVHRHVGFYFLVEGMQPGEAERHLQISLDLREELGDSRRTPSGLLALGQAVLESGGRDRAVELLRRAVAEARAADLLPERIREAERALAEAEAESTSGTDVPEADTQTGADDAQTMADTQTTTDAETTADAETEADAQTTADAETTAETYSRPTSRPRPTNRPRPTTITRPTTPRQTPAARKRRPVTKNNLNDLGRYARRNARAPLVAIRRSPGQ